MVGLGGGFILVPILRLFFGFSPAVRGRHLARPDRRQQRERRLHLPAAAPRSLEDRLAHRCRRPARRHPRRDRFAPHLRRASSIRFSRSCSSPSRSTWRWNARATHGRASGAPARPRRSKACPIARALGLGFVVGIFSSLFGLGGGIILVPTFLYFSELPAHAISATSHFAILLTSPVGLVVHILQHDIVGARRRPARRRRIARRARSARGSRCASLAPAPDRRRSRAASSPRSPSSGDSYDALANGCSENPAACAATPGARGRVSAACAVPAP